MPPISRIVPREHHRHRPPVELRPTQIPNARLCRRHIVKLDKAKASGLARFLQRVATMMRVSSSACVGAWVGGRVGAWERMRAVKPPSLPPASATYLLADDSHGFHWADAGEIVDDVLLAQVVRKVPHCCFRGVRAKGRVSVACGRKDGLFWLNRVEQRKSHELTEHRARGLPRVSSLVHMRQIRLFVAGTPGGLVYEVRASRFNSQFF